MLRVDCSICGGPRLLSSGLVLAARRRRSGFFLKSRHSRNKVDCVLPMTERFKLRVVDARASYSYAHHRAKIEWSGAMYTSAR